MESCSDEYSPGSFANLIHLDVRMVLETDYEDHFLLERHLDSLEEKEALGDMGICSEAPFASVD